MHDRDGKVLAVGDIVAIPAKITAIQTGADYCNCTIELTERMPTPNGPDKYPTTYSSINTRQVVKTTV